jgi:hypothetical protein
MLMMVHSICTKNQKKMIYSSYSSDINIWFITLYFTYKIPRSKIPATVSRRILQERSDVIIPLRRVSRFNQANTYSRIQMKRNNYYHTTFITTGDETIVLVLEAGKFQSFSLITLTAMSSIHSV